MCIGSSVGVIVVVVVPFIFVTVVMCVDGVIVSVDVWFMGKFVCSV